MEGAVDPFFRVRRGDALEEETGRWFDRLFELRDLQEELWRSAAMATRGATAAQEKAAASKNLPSPGTIATRSLG